jgi:hypothetical protein
LGDRIARDVEDPTAHDIEDTMRMFERIGDRHDSPLARPAPAEPGSASSFWSSLSPRA